MGDMPMENIRDRNGPEMCQLRIGEAFNLWMEGLITADQYNQVLAAKGHLTPIVEAIMAIPPPIEAKVTSADIIPFRKKVG